MSMYPAMSARANDITGAGENDRSAAAAALGAEVDDIVAGFYDIKVMLDNNNGVARIGKSVDYINELVHISHVQAGRRLV